MHVNRKEEEEGETEHQEQTYQFTKGYNILYRLQVPSFMIHNKYISTLLFIYIHTQILCIVLITTMFIKNDTLNIRYKFLGNIKKTDRSRQEFMIYISFSCECLYC